MTIQNSTSNNQIACISVDINPQTGEWVSILDFEHVLGDTDFEVLEVTALGMAGFKQLRDSLCRRRVFLDFWDTGLSEHEIHSMTEEIADELTGETAEEREPLVVPLFSHAIRS